MVRECLVRKHETQTEAIRSTMWRTRNTGKVKSVSAIKKTAKGDLTPFVIMFTDIIEESMKQLEEALQKRYQKLMYYRDRIQYLPMGLNEKYIDFYDYLLQASLFSESGISVEELKGLMRVSRPTVFNRLKDLSAYNLIEKKSLGNNRYYNLNLDEVEKLSSANTDEE